MRLRLAALIVFSISVSASVLESSNHYSDAHAVQALINASGYSTDVFNVEIQWLEEYGESYFVDWFTESWDDDYEDFTKVRVVLGAVAIVSSSTEWTSSYLVVCFTDKIVLASTADARWLFDNADYLTEGELSMWFTNHLTFLDYD